MHMENRNLMASSDVFTLNIILTTFLLIMDFGVVANEKGMNISSAENEEIIPTRTRHGGKPEDLCSTAECEAAGAFFKARMNLKANPCEDFYEYACGHWLKTNVIPEAKGSWSQFNVLREDVSNKAIKLLLEPKVTSPKSAVENAKAYFQTCAALDNSTQNDVRGMAKLREIVSRFADLKRLKTKGAKQYDWEVQVGRLEKEFGIGCILSSGVAPYARDNKIKKIHFGQPNFGLGRETMVNADKPSEKKRVSAYKKYMTKSFCHLYQGCTKVVKKEVKKEADEIFAFESQLAKFTIPPEEMRVISKYYKRRGIGELCADIPEIKWKEYLDEIVSTIGQNYSDIPEVIMRGEPYYQRAAGFLKKTNKETIVMYIAWTILRHLGPFATQRFRKNNFQLKKVLSGVKKPEPMEQWCFNLINDLMGYAVGSLYVKHHFSKESKCETEILIKDLKRSMKTMIDKNEWMDSITKKKADEKLEKFRDYIGFPSWILEDQELNTYYKVEPINTTDFLGSHLRLVAFHAKNEILKLIHEVDQEREWGVYPAVVNAFYNSQKNSIFFPAGILQPPFFYNNTLTSLNYGAIGYVIGHEITHGFDDKGSQYDGDGNLKNWWSNKTLSEFNQRKECFLKLYGNITDKQTNLKLNSKNTIGEDIADNGGIRQAFEAFSSSKPSNKRLPGLEDLTPHQLFFVAAANVWCSKYRPESLRNIIQGDAHTPAMYRPVLPLSNEEHFATSFNCKNGSKMNPINKCILW